MRKYLIWFCGVHWYKKRHQHVVCTSAPIATSNSAMGIWLCRHEIINADLPWHKATHKTSNHKKKKQTKKYTSDTILKFQSSFEATNTSTIDHTHIYLVVLFIQSGSTIEQRLHCIQMTSLSCPHQRRVAILTSSNKQTHTNNHTWKSDKKRRIK